SVLAPAAPSGGLEKFGTSVALVINAATATIAVGAPNHCDCSSSYYGGAVYLYAGSGASYPLQTTLLDTGSTEQEQFGYSVALASSGSTNTLVVGARYKSLTPGDVAGAAFVYTGSGVNYSSNVTLRATDPGLGDYFGSSVAIAVSGGTTAIAVGAPNKTPPGHLPLGAAYVFTSSGAEYTGTQLALPIPDDYNYFGSGVAVGFSYSVVEVAVGGSYANTNTAEGPNVLLFTQNGAKTAFVQSSLPEPGATFSDGYGQGGLAVVVAPNQSPTVIGGASNAASGAGSATLSSWDASASLRATFGDGSQTVTSPSGTYSGTPFHLVARLVDGNGNPVPPAGITFTVNANGGTGGLFNAADSTSTTLHVITHDGTNGTTAGQTDTINLYPSSTAGQFTVTATADGTALNATYALTIIASVPKPTINPVVQPNRPIRAALDILCPARPIYVDDHRVCQLDRTDRVSDRRYAHRRFC
ncbi:MAG: FG-GAP repeat protein, partial [Thermomicrobia bacterium]|nr:FG-GAP repeat protein [Thermomicrobia bacterium]